MNKPYINILNTQNRPDCIICANGMSYNSKYDSFFCNICQEWDGIGDPELCANRPAKPWPNLTDEFEINPPGSIKLSPYEDLEVRRR